MAFNRQTFKTRTLTAIVFAAVMLLGLLWNHWSFFILFSIIHFGCWIEYQELIYQIDPGYKEISPVHKYGVMIAGWGIMLWFTNDAYQVFGLRLHELGWWLGLLLIFLLPLSELLFTVNISLKNIKYSLLGLIYISLSWGLMIDLWIFKEMPSNFEGGQFWLKDTGFLIPLLILISIWINDTMAYIVGSLIGKNPLSKISPKKTWEGTIGGILLSILAVTLFLQSILYWKHLLAISLIAAIAGTFGDLLESKLKRLAGVKDSGSLMPGHGGFLDRFDSLLLAIPFVWLYIQLFTK